MSKVRVTIGFCARNREKIIPRAVNSIMKQNFSHRQIEVIFVDDGSEDKTLKVMRKCAERVDMKTKIFSTKWRGLGAARNTVFSNAAGDYIVWVDSDEILEEHHVKKQVEFMDSNPDVGIAVGMLEVYPEASRVLVLENIPDVVDYRRFQKESDLTKLPGSGGATYRVDSLREVGGFEEEMEGAGEDQEVAFRIRKRGWRICATSAGFYETKGEMRTIRDLWNKYFWYGRSGYALHSRNKDVFSLLKMSPFAGFIHGLSRLIDCYKMTRRRLVFLLPFHNSFKMISWFFGFSQASLSHRLSNRDT